MRVLYRVTGILFAVVLVFGMGVLTERPSLGESEKDDLAEPYDFDVRDLNSAPEGAKYGRTVAPDLRHFRAWISGVGAGVALTDLRDLGRPADACLVDPRDDSVTLRSVPGSGAPEYPVVELLPDGLPYDDTMAPMGCVPADLDEDGDVDFLVYYWGRSPVLFMNEAGPDTAPSAEGFTAHELVEPMRVWNTTAVNVADLDGSGHLDIVIGNYFPDDARVLDPSADDETRMEMQHSMSLARNAGRNKVLLTEPTGESDAPPEVTDASNALPEHVATAWTLAMGFQDLTGNHRPDVYVANDFGNDHLLVNRSRTGEPRFDVVTGERDMTTPKSKVLGNGSFKGMGVTFTYRDPDELPMMVVSNITSPHALHESNFAFVPDGTGSDLLDGTVPYSDESEPLGISRSGWSWDVKSGDFDNSGTEELLQATGFMAGETDRWPELQEVAMGNDALLKYPAVWANFEPGEDDLSGHEHNPFWAADAGGGFVDLAPQLGLDSPDVTRAFALGDVNGDGLLDAVVANQWQDSRVLLNRAPDAPPGISLRLVRPGESDGGWPAAIGASVTTREGVEPAQKRQLYPANGHVGVSADRMHLAAPGSGPLPVTITWRAGGRTHEAEVEVPPGSATVELHDDGTAVLR
ncbi:VCBS repeat-containing protein [Haloechinothrix sp. YIM 98757]|uniref:VCBS repeat-containing protein n=1 Tax=Haloechinothrix aidingensis TaxID=2752311 RepID=A0A838A8Y0_9PSEU|nr:VCBS repeat-containing protein [Haloechinothrix aidingensis]MBA0125307.1 VCBS repeat-containing protein [Haloechinothrix aidingensis]